MSGYLQKPGSGGGGGTWGSITGTLSNQTDLQNALNLKYDASNPAGYITSSALSGYTPTSRTITINGTTQDLSANRSWTITVPTKTSDLTNDSGFVTSSALSNYVAKTGNETIAGLKTFTSDIYGTKDSGRAFRVGSLSGGDNNIWLGPSAISPTAANFVISTSINNSFTIFNSPSGRMYFGINNLYLFNVSSSGAYFGGTLTSATAKLHISAGSASANTAPLKFTSGTNLATPEAGAVEYNGSDLFFTPSTTRYKLGQVVAGSSTIASGTYTPTLTNVTNITSSTADKFQWMRVGNVVTVSGRVNIQNTATGASELGISLPIASDIGATTDCVGSAPGSTSGILDDVGWVIGDATNNRAAMQSTAVGTGAHDHWVSFTYEVI